jgi:hypothetical protein
MAQSLDHSQLILGIVEGSFSRLASLAPRSSVTDTLPRVHALPAIEKSSLHDTDNQLGMVLEPD